MQNLKSKLPVYMLPTNIIFEDKLPVGKNEKQDRKEVVRWIKAHENRTIENEGEAYTMRNKDVEDMEAVAW